MAKQKKDISGMRFGRLVAIKSTNERAIRKNNKKAGYIWECQCDCGNIVNIEIGLLTGGYTKSCGCLHSEIVSRNMKKGNLEGQKFGKLKVIKWLPVSERAENNKYSPYLCLCECGNYVQAKTYELKSGNKKSCGCIHEQYSHEHKETARTHGQSKTRLYKVWSVIKDRCLNSNNKAYQRYGGRGISICQEWLDFEHFRDWAYSNGYDENAPRGKCTLDRIDNDGNYEPSNCMWATMKEQRLNQSCTKLHEYKGKRMVASDWAKELNIPYEKIRIALNKENKTIEEFLNNYNGSK